jgi:hypothetical protein
MFALEMSAGGYWLVDAISNSIKKPRAVAAGFLAGVLY